VPGDHVFGHTCLFLQDKIRDKLGASEMRASLLLRAGRRAEAEKQYRDLLATNPDHYRWHEGLQAALGLRVGGGRGRRCHRAISNRCTCKPCCGAQLSAGMSPEGLTCLPVYVFVSLPPVG
jgi:hypothetical protein